MGWTRLDDNYNILLDYLDEKQTYAFEMAIHAFGYNEHTLDCLVYAMFGYPTLDKYVTDCLVGQA